MADNNLVANIAIVFDLNGQRKTLRFRALPLAAWAQLYDALGLEPRTLMTRWQNGSPIVAAAMIWLERKQRERNLTWVEVERELTQHEVEFTPVDLLVDDVSWGSGAAAEETTESDPLTSAGS